MDLKERPEKENLESGKLSINKDAQINLVVNRPDSDEVTIINNPGNHRQANSGSQWFAGT